jgi:hypothetical protein
MSFPDEIGFVSLNDKRKENCTPGLLSCHTAVTLSVTKLTTTDPVIA